MFLLRFNPVQTLFNKRGSVSISLKKKNYLFCLTSKPQNKCLNFFMLKSLFQTIQMSKYFKSVTVWVSVHMQVCVWVGVGVQYACLCTSACVHMCACVCVWLSAREREKERERVISNWTTPQYVPNLDISNVHSSGQKFRYLEGKFSLLS